MLLILVLLLIAISVIPSKNTAAFNEFCRLECQSKRVCAGRCR